MRNQGRDKHAVQAKQGALAFGAVQFGQAHLVGPHAPAMLQHLFGVEGKEN
jgi:hypothetical protein